MAGDVEGVGGGVARVRGRGAGGGLADIDGGGAGAGGVAKDDRAGSAVEEELAGVAVDGAEVHAADVENIGAGAEAEAVRRRGVACAGAARADGQGTGGDDVLDVAEDDIGQGAGLLVAADGEGDGAGGAGVEVDEGERRQVDHAGARGAGGIGRGFAEVDRAGVAVAEVERAGAGERDVGAPVAGRGVVAGADAGVARDGEGAAGADGDGVDQGGAGSGTAVLRAEAAEGRAGVREVEGRRRRRGGGAAERERAGTEVGDDRGVGRERRVAETGLLEVDRAVVDRELRVVRRGDEARERQGRGAGLHEGTGTGEGAEEDVGGVAGADGDGRGHRGAGAILERERAGGGRADQLREGERRGARVGEERAAVERHDVGGGAHAGRAETDLTGVDHEASGIGVRAGEDHGARTGLDDGVGAGDHAREGEDAGAVLLDGQLRTGAREVGADRVVRGDGLVDEEAARGQGERVAGDGLSGRAREADGVGRHVGGERGGRGGDQVVGGGGARRGRQGRRVTGQDRGTGGARNEPARTGVGRRVAAEDAVDDRGGRIEAVVRRQRAGRQGHVQGAAHGRGDRADGQGERVGGRVGGEGDAVRAGRDVEAGEGLRVDGAGLADEGEGRAIGDRQRRGRGDDVGRGRDRGVVESQGPFVQVGGADEGVGGGQGQVTQADLAERRGAGDHAIERQRRAGGRGDRTGPGEDQRTGRGEGRRGLEHAGPEGDGSRPAGDDGAGGHQRGRGVVDREAGARGDRGDEGVGRDVGAGDRHADIPSGGAARVRDRGAERALDRGRGDRGRRGRGAEVGVVRDPDGTGGDHRRADVGVGAREDQGARVGLGQGAGAGDDAADGQGGGAEDREGAGAGEGDRARAEVDGLGAAELQAVGAGDAREEGDGRIRGDREGRVGAVVEEGRRGELEGGGPADGAGVVEVERAFAVGDGAGEGIGVPEGQRAGRADLSQARAGELGGDDAVGDRAVIVAEAEGGTGQGTGGGEGLAGGEDRAARHGDGAEGVRAGLAVAEEVDRAAGDFQRAAAREGVRVGEEDLAAGDQRAAGVGVGAGEDEVTDAGLGERAGGTGQAVGDDARVGEGVEGVAADVEGAGGEVAGDRRTDLDTAGRRDGGGLLEGERTAVEADIVSHGRERGDTEARDGRGLGAGGGRDLQDAVVDRQGAAAHEGEAGGVVAGEDEGRETGLGEGARTGDHAREGLGIDGHARGGRDDRAGLEGEVGVAEVDRAGEGLADRAVLAEAEGGDAGADEDRVGDRGRIRAPGREGGVARDEERAGAEGGVVEEDQATLLQEGAARVGIGRAEEQGAGAGLDEAAVGDDGVDLQVAVVVVEDLVVEGRGADIHDEARGPVEVERALADKREGGDVVRGRGDAARQRQTRTKIDGHLVGGAVLPAAVGIHHQAGEGVRAGEVDGARGVGREDVARVDDAAQALGEVGRREGEAARREVGAGAEGEGGGVAARTPAVDEGATRVAVS